MTTTPPAPSPVLELRGVERIYPPQSSDDPPRGITGVSFQARRGERIAVVGPNGAGKTTLLDLIATAARPTSGDLRIANVSIAANGTSPRADLRVTGVTIDRTTPDTNTRLARENVAFASAQPILDPLLTARENLMLAGRLRGLDRASISTATGRLAASLGVAERLDDRTGRFSTGLARRIDLIRAMLGSEPILVLDEPTAPLDEPSREALVAALKDRAASGTLILFSTHRESDIHASDRVLCVDTARVIADIPRDRALGLLETPICSWTPSPAIPAIPRSIDTADGRSIAADHDRRVSDLLRGHNVSFAVAPLSLADLPRFAAAATSPHAPEAAPA